MWDWAACDARYAMENHIGFPRGVRQGGLHPLHDRSIQQDEPHQRTHANMIHDAACGNRTMRHCVMVPTWLCHTEAQHTTPYITCWQMGGYTQGWR